MGGSPLSKAFQFEDFCMWNIQLMFQCHFYGRMYFKDGGFASFLTWCGLSSIGDSVRLYLGSVAWFLVLWGRPFLKWWFL
eukprot:Gb_14583 [translate_table: standard]